MVAGVLPDYGSFEIETIGRLERQIRPSWLWEIVGALFWIKLARHSIFVRTLNKHVKILRAYMISSCRQHASDLLGLRGSHQLVEVLRSVERRARDEA